MISSSCRNLTMLSMTQAVPGSSGCWQCTTVAAAVVVEAATKTCSNSINLKVYFVAVAFQLAAANLGVPAGLAASSISTTGLSVCKNETIGCGDRTPVLICQLLLYVKNSAVYILNPLPAPITQRSTSNPKLAKILFVLPSDCQQR
jgi:hypothetical protein